MNALLPDPALGLQTMDTGADRHCDLLPQKTSAPAVRRRFYYYPAVIAS